MASSCQTPRYCRAEKAALEQTAPLAILAVHPPSEIRRQASEDALQKAAIAAAVQQLFDAIEENRGPGVNGGAKAGHQGGVKVDH